MTKNQKVMWLEQGSRLRELLKTLELTQEKFANIVGSKQASVSHALGGKMGIPPSWFIDIVRQYPEVNIDWVLSGDGQMLKGEVTEVQEPQIEYVKGNARALSNEEVAVMIARLQKEVAELQEWKKEASRAMSALEVQVLRLKE